jgi:hypothetical protein
MDYFAPIHRLRVCSTPLRTPHRGGALALAMPRAPERYPETFVVTFPIRGSISMKTSEYAEDDPACPCGRALQIYFAPIV